MKKVELEKMNLEEVAENLKNIDVETVRVKIEDNKNTHIEFDFRYDKNRKKYYLSSNPVKIEGYMISYELFSGSVKSLNELPIGRKSPKQEKIARGMITIELLKSMLEEIEKNKRK